MPTIHVDFEVFKALTVRRRTEAMTENDVIRELLELPPAAPTPVMPDIDCVWEGVHFPAGTEFRAKYKGILHYGKIEAGALVLNGRRFNAASPAARSITGNSVNGWTFWEARLPGQERWQVIKSLRQ